MSTLNPPDPTPPSVQLQIDSSATSASSSPGPLGLKVTPREFSQFQQWKQLGSPVASSSSSSVSPGPLSPNSACALRQCRFIIIHTRPLTPAEVKMLARHFKNVLVVDERIHANKNDLSQLQFDCMVVNFEVKALVRWFDEIKLEAKLTPSIKTVGVERVNSCCRVTQDVWEDLMVDAVIKSLPTDEFLDIDSFFRKLIASSGKKILSAASTFFGKVAAASSS